jgi:hypothetical protein
MKHLNLFENFENSSTININDIINNKKIINYIENLPIWVKVKIQKYYDGNDIDINQLVKINNRFNIIDKVKKLYDKGITNIKDICNKILPKNESVGLIVLSIILIIIGLILITIFPIGFPGKYDLLSILIGCMFLFGGLYGFGLNYVNNKIIDTTDCEIIMKKSVKIENKYRTIILLKNNETGEYKLTNALDVLDKIDNGEILNFDDIESIENVNDLK